MRRLAPTNILCSNDGNETEFILDYLRFSLPIVPNHSIARVPFRAFVPLFVMSSPEPAVCAQCADADCQQSDDNLLQAHCRECKRPMHLECGTPREGGDEQQRERLCSNCSDTEVKPVQGPSKRRRLNLTEKLRALDMLDRGVSLQKVADEFGSSKRAIMRMKQEGNVIRSLGQSGAKGSMKSRKQKNSVKYTALETKIAQVIDVSRRNRILITSDLVRNCALRVREEMLKKENVSEEEAMDLKSFSPTDFWVKSFTKRRGLKLTTKPWQLPIAPSIEPVSREAQSFEVLLQRFDLDCIFSVNETTLFHKVLPRRTYLTTESIPAGNTTTMVFPDDMRAEDRLILIVCTNATGTAKIPLALIGTSKQPKSFCIRPCPLAYLARQDTHAWFERKTFKQWFNQVFIPAARKHSCKNVALLVENIPIDQDIDDPRGQVTILGLPPHLRSRAHSAEYGIMTLLKQKYRYAMLERVIDLLPAREQIRAYSSGKAQDFHGLDDGRDPNELDTAELLDKIWERTSKQSIARSWIKTNVLPDSYNASLATRHGTSQAYGRVDILMESCTSEEKEIIWRIEEMLRRRRFEAKEGAAKEFQLLVGMLNSINERELEAWLSLEERPEIRAALAREAQESLLLSVGSGSRSKDATSKATEATTEDVTCTQMEQPLPSLATIAKLFGPLEEFISVFHTRDAAWHIRQAKRILLAAKVLEMESNTDHMPQANQHLVPPPPPLAKIHR